MVEEVASIDGLYGPAIAKIVLWLEKAAGVAENEGQRKVIEALIDYYRTGDLEKFDAYNILWVEDPASMVDFVNGFIEVYNDPLGMKASWESLVDFKDLAATKRADTLSANAQWFEDNSPVDPRFKKKEVKGVSAKVITAAMLGGDCYPSTPIGINLPNANWIRKNHGSKSVTLENITYAYDQSSLKSGFGKEFSWSEEILERSKKYGPLAGNIHTDMHEVLGHGSGQLMPGVGPEALKNYHSPVEEARADLFALYYIADPKMIELGLLPDPDAAKAEYDANVRNGLMTQLTRIELGKTVEQAHMRSRAMVSHWVYEKGKAGNVISRETKDGKTFFVINDYEKLRGLYGELLAEVQRITSEGDYEAARALVEGYGVQVDQPLHKEVLERYAKLNLAPYAGFVNPVYTPVIGEREDRRRQDLPRRGLRRADAEVREGLRVPERHLRKERSAGRAGALTRLRPSPVSFGRGVGDAPEGDEEGRWKKRSDASPIIFPKIGVAVIEVTAGVLKAGETIRIKGTRAISPRRWSRSSRSTRRSPR